MEKRKMIKIKRLVFTVLLLHTALYAVVDIQKYIERTPKVEDKKVHWVFEFKNKDKEGYLLTIVSGTELIADELYVLPARDGNDGQIRINIDSGLNPALKDTRILLRDKKNKIVKAWYIPSKIGAIFVSYEKGKLTPQRSGTLQGLYASKTTSGLPVTGNVKQNDIESLYPDDVIKFIKEKVKNV